MVLSSNPAAEVEALVELTRQLAERERRIEGAHAFFYLRPA